MDKFFYLVLLLLLLSGSFLFTTPNIELGGHNVNNIFYHIHENLPWWINLLKYFIYVFVFTTIVTLVLTNLYAFEKIRKEKMHNRYHQIYLNELIKNLFSENTEKANKPNFDLNRLKKYAKNDYYRELVIKTLIKIHHQTEGKIHNDCEIILDTLDYDHLIYSYLHSPYYKHKKFALEVIAEFRQNRYNNYLLKFVNKKRNKILHTDALITLTQIDTYQNLSLLALMKTKLTLWDVNVIVRNIVQNKLSDIPYHDLINAKDDGMLLIGIILVRLQKKQEFKKDIIDKINHHNALVCEEAIITFASLAENKDDYDLLIKSYKKSTNKSKVSIIEAMKLNTDINQVADFMEKVIKEESISNKLNALKYLLAIDTTRVIKLKQSDNKIIREACKEVLDINF